TLRESPNPTRFDWARLLDGVQVGILVLAAYLFFFLVPTQQETPDELARRLLGVVFNSRNAFLLLAFFLRAAMSANPATRAFSARVALFWTSYSVLTAGTNLARRFLQTTTGQGFYDLGWSLPFIIGAVLVATWKQEREPRPFTEPSRGLRAQLSLYLLPTIVPLAIILMAGKVTATHFYLAYGTIIASFACYSARLIVTQHQLAKSTVATQLAEARFHTLFANNPQPVWVFRTDSLQLLEANAAAEKHLGYPREELLQMKASD